MIVAAKAGRGNTSSFSQLWGVGPKWDITCGNCEATFNIRMPLVDNPGIPCPHCQAINKINLTWNKQED